MHTLLSRNVKSMTYDLTIIIVLLFSFHNKILHMAPIKKYHLIIFHQCIPPLVQSYSRCTQYDNIETTLYSYSLSPHIYVFYGGYFNRVPVPQFFLMSKEFWSALTMTSISIHITSGLLQFYELPNSVTYGGETINSHYINFFLFLLSIFYVTNILNRGGGGG